MGKVLHASASGYLPFCITPASTIPQEVRGTYYPFALSLDQTVSLFWRVKKWTYEDNLGPVGENFQFFTPIENEENIVCNPALYSYFKTFDRGSAIDPLEIFSGTTRDYKPVLKVGDLYYPFIYFFGILQGSDFLTSIDQEYPENGTFTMSWLGHNISAPLYGSTQPDPPFIAKFTAQEYWSYGGTYDTSTGAPL